MANQVKITSALPKAFLYVFVQVFHCKEQCGSCFRHYGVNVLPEKQFQSNELLELNLRVIIFACTVKIFVSTATMHNKSKQTYL